MPVSQHRIHLRVFQSADLEPVIALWQRCGLTRSWNNPHRDIQRKRAASPDGFIVALKRGKIVGSVMVGYDGHRGWINYLGVDPREQRLGIGRMLMHRAEAYLKELGCPKINLQIRRENSAAIGFYRALGYLEDDVVSFGKRLEPDLPGTRE